MEGITWPILFLILALGLLIGEVFLPSGGLLGVLATTCLGVSLYLVSQGGSIAVSHWLGIEVAAVGITWLGTIQGLPRTRLGRRVYLHPPTDDELDSRRLVEDQVGRSGRALTPLRPSGMIDMEGRRVEAMAESGLIAAGELVTVVAVRSGRAIVRVD